jgi:hypothetical protein
MSNEEKKQMQMVKDLVLAIAESIELSSPKDEAEHQTVLVTGVVTYLNQWLDFMSIDKKTKLSVIRTFAMAVMHAANIIEKRDGNDDVSDEDIN